MFRYALGNMDFADPAMGEEIATQLIGIIADAVTNGDTTGLFDTLSEFTSGLMTGVRPSEEDIEEASEAWGEVFGPEGLIMQWFSGLDLAPEVLETLRAALESVYDPFGIFGDGLESTTEKAYAAADAYSEATAELSDYEKGLRDITSALQRTNTSLNATSALTKQVKEWRDLYKAYQDAKAGAGDVAKAIKNLTPAARRMNAAFDGSESAIEDANSAYERMANYVLQQSVALENTIMSLEQQLWELAAINPIVFMSGDPTGLIAAIAAAREELAALLADMAIAGITSVGSGSGHGGGGGGGSRPSSGGGGVSESAYEKEIKAMEHLKALDQLTYEQELANLEDISRRQIASAEERLDLEERIFDVKKAIAERDAENLDDLLGAMMDALAARYEKKRDAELESLDKSAEAWEKWRDHNVEAIQKQIDALDELEEAEDREANKQELLRKVANLEQSIAYEQDDYNKRQLQKQLEAAKAKYEDYLKEIEREDKRDDLEQQMKDINDKADDELEKLDKQRKKIEDYYKERLKQANLQAEAEVLLAKSTQKQIIKLLAEYAPDYDAAGRSLGEKFMKSFEDAVGDASKWLNDFIKKYTDAIDKLDSKMRNKKNKDDTNSDQAGATDAFAGSASQIVINQENNFNVPVETPAETARRIQQANEDLAEQIAGG